MAVSASDAAHGTGIYVQEAGESVVANGNYTERQGLESFLISYEYIGIGHLDYVEKSWSFIAGDVTWIDCRNYYRTACSGDSHSIFVHFYGPLAAYYYEQFFRLNQECPLIHPKNPEKLTGKIREIIELYQNDSSIDIDFRAIELLISLMTQIISDALPAAGKKKPNHYVQDTRQYIQEHYAESLSLEGLAKRVHISKFYLNRLFQKQIGMTPKEYITQLRLNRAKELLRQTDQSVLEICESIGFVNPSYFIRLFRRFENVSPGEYRKKWGKLS